MLNLYMRKILKIGSKYAIMKIAKFMHILHKLSIVEFIFFDNKEDEIYGID